MQTDYTLSDEAISSIAKILQLAILTGTDIVDNLRTLRLTQSDGKLVPTDAFNEGFENIINKMIAAKSMEEVVDE